MPFVPYPAKTNPKEILQVALELLEEDASSLSMRNLAERLAIKAPSLYRHFKDKDALEFALIDEGAKALHAVLEKATQNLKARPAFFATANAYLQFAREHPELYTLMMTTLTPPTQDSAGKTLWNFVLGVVSQITRKPDDTPSAVAFWSFLHGFSVLERSGMFGASGPKGGFEVGLEAFLKGLSKSN